MTLQTTPPARTMRRTRATKLAPRTSRTKPAPLTPSLPCSEVGGVYEADGWFENDNKQYLGREQSLINLLVSKR